MSKYLFVYDNSLGTRQRIVDVLSSISEVRHWRYDMPNSFYIDSEASAEALTNKIRNLCGGNGRCIMVKLNSFYGWLPDKTWAFLHRED